MSVQIHINGENAQEALKELSGLTALLGNPVAVAPAAQAVQEPAKQEEAPKPKSSSRSKQKQDEAAPVEPETKPADGAAPAEDPAPAQEADPELEAVPEQSEGNASTYTVEQVRAKLGELAKAGKSADVKQIIKDMGAENITTLDPAKYPEVMKRAAELE